jgi:hypothetical protein
MNASSAPLTPRVERVCALPDQIDGLVKKAMPKSWPRSSNGQALLTRVHIDRLDALAVDRNRQGMLARLLRTGGSQPAAAVEGDAGRGGGSREEASTCRHSPFLFAV